MRFLFFASVWTFFVMAAALSLTGVMTPLEPLAKFYGTMIGLMATINGVAFVVACIVFFVRFANRMIDKAKKKPVE